MPHVPLKPSTFEIAVVLETFAAEKKSVQAAIMHIDLPSRDEYDDTCDTDKI